MARQEHNSPCRVYIRVLHSRKLTWKPKKGPMKTTVPLKGDLMGFHVSLGECITPIVENQMENKMDNGMETVIILGYMGSPISALNLLGGSGEFSK